MEEKLAKIISYIFHPLIMPTVGIWLILHTNTYMAYAVSDPTKWFITLIIFMATFVLPALCAAYLLHSGLISSMHMPSAQERRLPFLLTAIIYYLTYYLIKQLPILITVAEFSLPSIIYFIILGATFSVLLALIINFKWKISVHMIGIGGLVGTLLGISLKYSTDLKIFICASIIVAGLIGSSRLKLKAHRLSQVYAGFFVGIFCELVFILSA
jgi:hypothetical protein